MRGRTEEELARIKEVAREAERDRRRHQAKQLVRDWNICLTDGESPTWMQGPVSAPRKPKAVAGDGQDKLAAQPRPTASSAGATARRQQPPEDREKLPAAQQSPGGLSRASTQAPTERGGAATNSPPASPWSPLSGVFPLGSPLRAGAYTNARLGHSSLFGSGTTEPRTPRGGQVTVQHSGGWRRAADPDPASKAAIFAALPPRCETAPPMVEHPSEAAWIPLRPATATGFASTSPASPSSWAGRDVELATTASAASGPATPLLPASAAPWEFLVAAQPQREADTARAAASRAGDVQLPVPTPRRGPRAPYPLGGQTAGGADQVAQAAAIDQLRRVLTELQKEAWQPALWLKARNEVLAAGNPGDALALLAQSVRASTDRAAAARSYDVWQPGGRRQRVDLAMEMAVVPSVEWFGRRNLGDMVWSAPMGDEKPLGASDGHFGEDGAPRSNARVTDRSALELVEEQAALVRSVGATVREAIVIAEVNAWARNNRDVDLHSSTCVSPQDLLLRTDLARFLQQVHEDCWRDGKVSVRQQLTAREDPYVFKCNKVTVLRGPQEQGYPFLENPIQLTVIVMALPTEIAGVQIIHFQRRSPAEWYTSRDDEHAMLDRLNLLGELIRRVEAEEGLAPDVFMDLPTAGLTYRHPHDAVGNSLKHWCRHFGQHAYRIYFCCRMRCQPDPFVAERYDWMLHGGVMTFEERKRRIKRMMDQAISQRPGAAGEEEVAPAGQLSHDMAGLEEEEEQDLFDEVPRQGTPVGVGSVEAHNDDGFLEALGGMDRILLGPVADMPKIGDPRASSLVTLLLSEELKKHRTGQVKIGERPKTPGTDDDTASCESPKSPRKFARRNTGEVQSPKSPRKSTRRSSGEVQSPKSPRKSTRRSSGEVQSPKSTRKSECRITGEVQSPKSPRKSECHNTGEVQGSDERRPSTKPKSKGRQKSNTVTSTVTPDVEVKAKQEWHGANLQTEEEERQIRPRGGLPLKVWSEVPTSLFMPDRPPSRPRTPRLSSRASGAEEAAMRPTRSVEPMRGQDTPEEDSTPRRKSCELEVRGSARSYGSWSSPRASMAKQELDAHAQDKIMMYVAMKKTANLGGKTVTETESARRRSSISAVAGGGDMNLAPTEGRVSVFSPNRPKGTRIEVALPGKRASMVTEESLRIRTEARHELQRRSHANGGAAEAAAPAPAPSEAPPPQQVPPAQGRARPSALGLTLNAPQGGQSMPGMLSPSSAASSGATPRAVPRPSIAALGMAKLKTTAGHLLETGTPTSHSLKGGPEASGFFRKAIRASMMMEWAETSSTPLSEQAKKDEESNEFHDLLVTVASSISTKLDQTRAVSNKQRNKYFSSTA